MAVVRSAQQKPRERGEDLPENRKKIGTMVAVWLVAGKVHRKNVGLSTVGQGGKTQQLKGYNCSKLLTGRSNMKDLPEKQEQRLQ